MDSQQIFDALARGVPSFLEYCREVDKDFKLTWKVVRDRCFLKPAVVRDDGETTMLPFVGFGPLMAAERLIPGIIHVPGLRGNANRYYPAAAAGSNYSGTFEKYTASIVSRWQEEGDQDRLRALSEDLICLALTGIVSAACLGLPGGTAGRASAIGQSGEQGPC